MLAVRHIVTGVIEKGGDELTVKGLTPTLRDRTRNRMRLIGLLSREGDMGSFRHYAWGWARRHCGSEAANEHGL